MHDENQNENQNENIGAQAPAGASQIPGEDPTQTPTTSPETRKYSLHFPITLFLLGATTLIFSLQLPVFIQRGQRLPGPQYFPTILGVFLCIAGVVELLRYLDCRRRNLPGCEGQAPVSGQPPAPSGKHGFGARIEGVAKSWGNQSVALLLVSLLVFVLVLPSLGFVLTGFIFSLVMLLRLNAKPLPAVLLSVVLVVVIAFIFVTAFRVPLPRGILSLPF